MTESGEVEQSASTSQIGLPELLQSSSSGLVDDQFGSLNLDTLHSALLPDAHPLHQQLEQEIPYTADDGVEVAQHAGAASFGHFVDAWAYFGQAARAITEGQLSIARHLIYYSELRSALSILARHGIVIRSKQHLVLRLDGTVSLPPELATHEAVWKYFKAWMHGTQAEHLFLDKTRFSGVSLRDWLDSGGPTPRESMNELLQDVGYDLSNYSKDRVARNAASYGPRWITRPQEDGQTLIADFGDIWGLAEPTGNSGFEQFDSELTGLLVAYWRRQRQQPTKPEKYLADAIELAKSVGALTPETAARKLVSVARPAGQNNFLRFALAQSGKANQGVDSIRAMFGRAFVLARYASASTLDLFDKAAIDDDELDEWLITVGYSGGLWLTDNEETLREDLFFEAMEAAGELKAYEGSLFRLHLQRPRDVDRGSKFSLLTSWVSRDFARPLPLKVSA